jgi:hypothetical protein
MGYIPRSFVPNRPHTLGFIDTQDAAPSKGSRKEDISAAVLSSRNFSALDIIYQQWIARIDKLEITLEEMAAATLDKDFMEELATVERWFRVLSDAERRAGLYVFAQQMTQEQIKFFLQVL